MRVVDCEAFREAKVLGLTAQDAHTRRVECRDPHALGDRTEQMLGALAHLSRSFVRKGNGENLARPCFGVANHTRDAVRQHSRLSRARTGHDEQCGSAVENRLRLLWVQPVEKGIGMREVGHNSTKSNRRPPTHDRATAANRGLATETLEPQWRGQENLQTLRQHRFALLRARRWRNHPTSLRRHRF